jgi:hypothetical protein
MAQTNDIASFPDDCLPPQNDYSSRDKLFKAINAWAAPRGYAFITGRSTIEKRVKKKTITYNCDRRGSPLDAMIKRQRQTSSRGTNCLFSILAKESSDLTTWSVRYRPDPKYREHNHEPSPHQSAHPVLRNLSAETKTAVGNLSGSGVRPRDISTFLRNQSISNFTQQDIYNQIAETRRESYQGQSSIIAFAAQLTEEDFWNQLKVDDNDRVTAILFAHPESLAYLQSYPEVLILDCTHKTHRYNMPLLNMIGIDSCQRSFCIAFAFLSNQDENSFT